ncbi:MAG: hypothetical protein WCI00_07245 [bacterium]
MNYKKANDSRIRQEEDEEEMVREQEIILEEDSRDKKLEADIL